MSDKTKGYITYKEVCEILGIVAERSAGQAAVAAQNIETIKANRNTNYYKEDSIRKLAEDVGIFFKKYCAPSEVNISSPELQRLGLTPIVVPKGYNLFFYRQRYGDKKNQTYIHAFLREDVERLIAKVESQKITDEVIDSEYILSSEAINILGLEKANKAGSSRSLRLLGVEKITRAIGQGFEGYCRKDDVYSALEKAREFYQEYGVVDEFDLPEEYIRKNVDYYPMPSGYNWLLYNERLPNKEVKIYKNVVKRKDIELLKQGEVVKKKKKYKPKKKDKIELDITGYMPIDDIAKLLNCTRKILTIIRSNFEFDEIKVGSKVYILPESLDYFIEQRNLYYTEHVTSVEISREYLDGRDCRIVVPHIKSYNDTPQYFIRVDTSMAIAGNGIFKRTDVEKFLEEYNKKNSSDIIASTPFETFNSKLSYLYDWKDFGTNSKFTYNKWINHIKFKLGNSKDVTQTTISKINAYIQCTVLLKELLDNAKKKEIYEFTSSEVNLFQRGLTTLSQKNYLYNFFKSVYQDVVNEYGHDKISYKIAALEKPPRSSGKNSAEKKVITYSFEEYSKFFNYQLDLDLHIKNSLNEINNHNTANYVSTWLYAMLHLNNAWRNGDVNKFPSIPIDDLLLSYDIDNIEWLEQNELTLPQARGIITRVIQKEIVIAKTKMEGHFFCSDKLAPALCSAIIILTLYKRNANTNEDILMDFDTKSKKVDKTLLKNFFKGLSKEGLEFKSKKFNKTVMTLITYLANLSGDKKALEYVKYMRSHKEISNTLDYIDFDIEAVEGLSEMLFARGEFGYVTSLLLARLNGGEVNDFEETTKQIYSINKMFGDVTKMSGTIGFMNTIRGDRVSVAKYISEKSFEECQEILTDLFARKLVSKEGSDVQCLFNKDGCQKTHLSTCFDCSYHIPSIYALTSLCEVLKEDIKRFSQARNMPQKLKLSLSIHRKKLVLSEAVKKFGSEYVFNCLGINKDDFIEILSEIPDVKQTD